MRHLCTLQQVQQAQLHSRTVASLEGPGRGSSAHRAAAQPAPRSVERQRRSEARARSHQVKRSPCVANETVTYLQGSSGSQHGNRHHPSSRRSITSRSARVLIVTKDTDELANVWISDGIQMPAKRKRPCADTRSRENVGLTRPISAQGRSEAVGYLRCKAVLDQMSKKEKETEKESPRKTSLALSFLSPFLSLPRGHCSLNSVGPSRTHLGAVTRQHGI